MLRRKLFMFPALFRAGSTSAYEISALKPHTQEQRQILTKIKQMAEQEIAARRVLASQKPISLICEHLAGIRHGKDQTIPALTADITESNECLSEDLEAIDRQESAQLANADFEDNSSSTGQLWKDQSQDPSFPVTRAPCSGCGALLHCQDIKRPGFVSAEELKPIAQTRSLLRSVVCLRCSHLRRHKAALDVALAKPDYETVMATIRAQLRATVVVVVDMLDLPGSVVPGLYEMVGKHKFIIVGNKVDLLPREGRGWKERWTQCLRACCVSMGIPDVRIRHVSLISGKSGYGMEDLIDKLLSTEFDVNGEPVYIVGCTNAGKSTIFNRLLKSDYCKAKARDFIHRATISPWPGTTLNLLKFPVMNTTPWKRNERERNKKWSSEFESRRRQAETRKAEERKLHFSRYQKLEAPVLVSIPSDGGKISDKHQSFRDLATYRFDEAAGDWLPSDYNLDTVKAEYIHWDEFDERRFSDSRWCFDTPGLVNPNQVINYLTPVELERMFHGDKMWLPRTFVLQPGLSLLFGALARIDVLESSGPVYLTAHTPLPLHITTCEDALPYATKWSHALSVPSAEPEERHGDLPALEGSRVHIQGRGLEESVADVVLSSAGWAGVACDGPVELMMVSPGALGCVLRDPPLLPHAVNLKGRRIWGAREFALKMN